MSAETIKSFSSAAEYLKGPPGFMTSAAFSDRRWTLAGDQRDERLRLFIRKFLTRLDGLAMPVYPETGLMNHKTAQQRYVTGVDQWKPMENPFLDGVAVEFRHCVHRELPPYCWAFLAEVGFDVARLSQTAVVWGGFHDEPRPGMWMLYDGFLPDGWRVDGRTYGVRNRTQFEYRLGE